MNDWHLNSFMLKRAQAAAAHTLEVCNESFATSNKVVPTKTNERALAAGGAQ